MSTILERIRHFVSHALFIFRLNFNGKIRTPQFTEFAANAVLWTGCKGFILVIQFQYLFRAEMDTDSTSFAPLLPDMQFFQFGFPHGGFLFSVMHSDDLFFEFRMMIYLVAETYHDYVWVSKEK
jgi:hypothetical protein